MRRRLFSVVLLAAIVAPLISVAHDTDEVAVVMSPAGYTPQNLTITAGTTVTFTNTSADPLWPASNIHPTHAIYAEFDPKAAVAPGQTWPFTFNRPGVWTYHDHLYPSVTGTITVTDEGEAPPTSLWSPLVTWVNDLLDSFPGASRGHSLEAYVFDPTISADTTAVYSDPNALYSYLRVYGLPQTMQHLTALSAQLGTCHDAAHRVGRLAYELDGDAAFSTCSAACHSGCYHGATESFFRDHGTANLAANLDVLCSSELNSFVSHQCLHGIGHGLMAWANYEIHDALAACDLLDRGHESCYTGVFMENVVGSLDNDDDGHFTKYVSADPHYPCTVVEEKYKSACYFYQTSRMLQIFGATWPTIADTCASAPARWHRHCFESMGRDVGGTYGTSPPAAINACRTVSDPANRRHCLNGAVQNYFWDPAGQGPALAFCKELSAANEKSACYTTIIQRATLILPSPRSQREFCNSLETPWQGPCEAALN